MKIANVAQDKDKASTKPNKSFNKKRIQRNQAAKKSLTNIISEKLEAMAARKREFMGKNQADQTSQKWLRSGNQLRSPNGSSQSAPSGQMTQMPSSGSAPAINQNVVKRKLSKIGWQYDCQRLVYDGLCNEPRQFLHDRRDQRPQPISSHEDLYHDYVASAIGSLLIAVNLTRQRLLSFGTAESFHEARYKKPSTSLIYASQRLLIPLLIDGKKGPVDYQKESRRQREERERSAHIVLVIVDRDLDQRTSTMRCWDSNDQGESSPQRSPIRKAVSNIVRNAFWPENGIVSGSSHFEQVPVQQGRTCGMHTIWNAWSVILELKLRLDLVLTEALYDRALIVMNAAIRGQMTLGAIKAFLVHEGICEPPPQDQERPLNSFDDHQTIEVSDVLLNRIANRLDRRDWEDPSTPLEDWTWNIFAS